MLIAVERIQRYIQRLQAKGRGGDLLKAKIWYLRAIRRICTSRIFARVSPLKNGPSPEVMLVGSSESGDQEPAEPQISGAGLEGLVLPQADLRAIVEAVSRTNAKGESGNTGRPLRKQGESFKSYRGAYKT